MKDECPRQSSSIPSSGPNAGHHFNCFTVCVSHTDFTAASFCFSSGTLLQHCLLLRGDLWLLEGSGRKGRTRGKHLPCPKCLLSFLVTRDWHLQGQCSQRLQPRMGGGHYTYMSHTLELRVVSIDSLWFSLTHQKRQKRQLLWWVLPNILYPIVYSSIIRVRPF